MDNILARDERCQIQPAPLVETQMAEQTPQGVGLVFSVRPQFCDPNRKVGIGSPILQVFHKEVFSGFQSPRLNPTTDKPVSRKAAKYAKLAKKSKCCFVLLCAIAPARELFGFSAPSQ